MPAAIGSTSADLGAWALLLLMVVPAAFLALRRRRTGSRMQVHERLAELREQLEARRSLEGLFVQLEELARRVSQRVDEKCSRLQVLLHEADARIARLERIASQPFAAERPAPQPRPAPDPQPDRAASLTVRDDPTGAQGDPRHGEVYALADAGTAPNEIGRRLGLRAAEVELILNLRDMR